MAQVEVLSHWHQLVANLNHSSQDFYRALEGRLESAEIPSASCSRVEHSERGVLSAKREYLRVKRDEFTFDICAAPFGSGFFVSSWLVTQTGCLRWLVVACWYIFSPIMWLLYICRLIHRPKTYYEIDTELMFQSAVHGAVVATLEDLLDVRGVRPLSDSEKKPIMRELIGKMR